MTDFLKENWFKVGVLVIALVAVLFYFKGMERRTSLANNIRCQQEGSQLLERMKRELTSGQTYTDPEFLFSSKLNTCLLNGSRISVYSGATSLNAFILDVYANKELAGYTSDNIVGRETDIYGDKEKYERLEKEYFSE
ncbi:MAG: hypothetical protein Q7R93_05655 [bacterium]|nr:hypothetical protein [bacterium]